MICCRTGPWLFGEIAVGDVERIGLDDLGGVTRTRPFCLVSPMAKYGSQIAHASMLPLAKAGPASGGVR